MLEKDRAQRNALQITKNALWFWDVLQNIMICVGVFCKIPLENCFVRNLKRHLCLKMLCQLTCSRSAFTPAGVDKYCALA